MVATIALIVSPCMESNDYTLHHLTFSLFLIHSNISDIFTHSYIMNPLSASEFSRQLSGYVYGRLIDEFGYGFGPNSNLQDSNMTVDDRIPQKWQKLFLALEANDEVLAYYKNEQAFRRNEMPLWSVSIYQLETIRNTNKTVRELLKEENAVDRELGTLTLEKKMGRQWQKMRNASARGHVLSVRCTDDKEGKTFELQIAGDNELVTAQWFEVLSQTVNEIWYNRMSACVVPSYIQPMNNRLTDQTGKHSSVVSIPMSVISEGVEVASIPQSDHHHETRDTMKTIDQIDFYDNDSGSERRGSVESTIALSEINPTLPKAVELEAESSDEEYFDETESISSLPPPLNRNTFAFSESNMTINSPVELDTIVEVEEETESEKMLPAIVKKVPTPQKDLSQSLKEKPLPQPMPEPNVTTLKSLPPRPKKPLPQIPVMNEVMERSVAAVSGQARIEATPIWILDDIAMDMERMLTEHGISGSLKQEKALPPVATKYSTNPQTFKATAMGELQNLQAHGEIFLNVMELERSLTRYARQWGTASVVSNKLKEMTLDVLILALGLMEKAVKESKTMTHNDNTRKQTSVLQAMIAELTDLLEQTETADGRLTFNKTVSAKLGQIVCCLETIRSAYRYDSLRI